MTSFAGEVKNDIQFLHYQFIVHKFSKILIAGSLEGHGQELLYNPHCLSSTATSMNVML